MLTVSELYIYPIKSLGGIAVNSARVTDRGFEHDRRWMLVDSNNNFLTQRSFEKMALLQVSITDTGLKIEHKALSESIIIPFINETSETAIAQVWDDECTVQYVSKMADKWFSTMLGINCRLVYMPDYSRRSVEEEFNMGNKITSLTDGFPFMMVGQASLDDLNKRLTEPVPINRFRPNIVFTGGAPFQEDSMDHFKINETHFYGVKLCSRCVVTTIDQQSSMKGKEPLKTLATYRLKNNKVYFGQNLLAEGSGTVQVHDIIHLQ